MFRHYGQSQRNTGYRLWPDGSFSIFAKLNRQKSNIKITPSWQIKKVGNGDPSRPGVAVLKVGRGSAPYNRAMESLLIVRVKSRRKLALMGTNRAKGRRSG